MVLALKKNNLYIRLLVGTSMRKGNTSQKRKAREVTNLLRTWENELVADHFDLDKEESSIESNSCRANEVCP